MSAGGEEAAPQEAEAEVEEAEGEEDWGDEEDWGFDNPFGFWEGDAFRLEQFPAHPDSWAEGQVEVRQTMGALDLMYYLPSEGEWTHEDLTVEVSMFRTRVKKVGVELSSLSGTLLHAVRPLLTVWRLLEEGCLHVHLAKMEHRAWKSLWATGVDLLSHQGRKQSFPWHWGWREQAPADRQQFFPVPHATPPPQVQTDFRLDAVALCLGLDDSDDFEEHAVLRVHLARDHLQHLESVLPLEEVLTAEVQEQHVRIFLRAEGGTELDIFSGELKGRCVPELTAWQFVRAAKGDPSGKGESFNAAIEIALAKKDGEGRWDKLCSSRKHAEELAEQRAKKPLETKLDALEAKLGARYEELLGAGPAPEVPQQEEEEVRDLQEMQYLIDNSELQATTRGLGYRRSKYLFDKDGEELAEWGSVVQGIDAGDGWIKVGARFLPMKLNGKSVITGDVIALPRQP